MIIPCFIILTLSNISNQQIAVNTKKVSAIYKDGNFALYTTIQVNDKKYEVRESIVDIKDKIKKECSNWKRL